MSHETLRKAMGNQQAATQATHEARVLTARAYSESNAKIRQLDNQRAANTPTTNPPVKK